jgi:hypothetical protein
VSGHSTENCVTLRRKIYELIDAGSIKLNPVEQESLNTNDPPKVDNVTPEESTNFIGEGREDQEIEEPGDQKKNVHITAGAQNYTVTPVIFPEI